jgi:hypothetical protein
MRKYLSILGYGIGFILIVLFFAGAILISYAGIALEWEQDRRYHEYMTQGKINEKAP